MAELLELTTPEWLMVAVATAICVGGLLLPKVGNLLGLAFLGEDPAVTRWRAAWAERRKHQRALRQARRNEKRARKLQRQEAARVRKVDARRGQSSQEDAQSRL